jgi:hypothetical protein
MQAASIGMAARNSMLLTGSRYYFQDDSVEIVWVTRTKP